jgi:hypothetical protein
MRDWLDRMGIPQGGPNSRGVKEQAERLSRCRLSFQVTRGGKTGLVNQNLVDAAVFLDDAEAPARGFSHSLESVRLSENFWEQIKRHPVPLEEAAIRSLQGHSMALDLYCFLAYRLHVLPGPRAVSWSALKGQFGTGFQRIDHFRPVFLENLELAKAVYPAANVEVSERGVNLLPSRPPIAPKLIAIRGRTDCSPVKIALPNPLPTYSEAVCRPQAHSSSVTRRLMRRERMEINAIAMKAMRCCFERSTMVFNRR